MSKTNQLFLLADHIKLSLLERERARSLNLQDNTQDGHINRSLDQFRDGLETLQGEQKRLTEAGDESAVEVITDALPSLQKQFADLSSRFHGDTSSAETLRHPNNASLAADFAHAQSTHPQPRKANLRSPSSTRTPTPSTTKVVRFSDSPLPDPDSTSPPLPPDDPSRAALFGPYRDDPSGEGEGEGYRDAAELMDNQQVHAYHARVLQDQDDHLDRLGESIGRQRELSMQIGDELDAHVAMLDDVEAATDRHQGRLDRARRSLGRFARASSESKQMVAIIVLIIVLVLLIAILK
ncbi:hypothetical protein ACRALDRAFT_1082843 [Sodiomyces alcalophilus JCM 7366]|uniref:uncharacterized protein n=1 Tax=Sodiomyces alcalophilus JCM 7366 TaxID=591952 RepID=UPI0039B4F853